MTTFKSRLCFLAVRAHGCEELTFGELGRVYEIEPWGAGYVVHCWTRTGCIRNMWFLESRTDCLAAIFADAALHA